MEWMLMPLRRYADFSGRSRRMEFWMFQLFVIITTTVLVLITFSGVPWTTPENLDQAAGAGPLFWVGGLLWLVWSLAIFIPSLAVTVRRLHDREMSGWWYGGLLIASFIPLVNIIAGLGFIALLVVLLLPGTDGPNRYGPDPKDPSQAEVFA
jgi:uncharacterized membrane protein YhaH (DUF805 family)